MTQANSEMNHSIRNVEKHLKKQNKKTIKNVCTYLDFSYEGTINSQQIMGNDREKRQYTKTINL